MLTGEICNQVDAIWNAFWSGGVANPIEVIEQITYLLFLRRLDEIETLEKNKARTLGRPMARQIFHAGNDANGTPYAHYRWKHFKNMEARQMHELLADHVFPFLHRTQEAAAAAGGRPQAGCGAVAAEWRVPALCRCLHRGAAVYQEQLRGHGPGLVL